MELTVAGIQIDRRKIIAGIVIVLACIGLALLYRQVDVEALHERAKGLNGGLIFALVTLLPLVGFPVSVLHAIIGVRFGIGLGLLLVSVSIVLQTLLSYAIVRSAPQFFGRRLQPVRDRLPDAAHTPLTQFTTLLPGVPYFLQNYVLPLVNVPVRTALLWAVPIHILRSIIGIVFGEMSADLTPLRVAGFVLYAIAITVTCAWAFRRLQARIRDQRPKAGGRRRRASARSGARPRSRRRTDAT